MTWMKNFGWSETNGWSHMHVMMCWQVGRRHDTWQINTQALGLHRQQVRKSSPAFRAHASQRIVPIRRMRGKRRVAWGLSCRIPNSRQGSLSGEEDVLNCTPWSLSCFVCRWFPKDSWSEKPTLDAWSQGLMNLMLRKRMVWSWLLWGTSHPGEFSCTILACISIQFNICKSAQKF